MCLLNRFFAFLLFILLSAQVAFSSDIGCGRDTDRNGTVDRACTGTLDLDGDGLSIAQGDCLDDPTIDARAFNIRPGMPTTYGCAAGQWRVCDPTGSAGFNACSASLYCPNTSATATAVSEICSTCYYVKSGGNNSNNGTTAALAWSSLEPFSTHEGGSYPAGKHVLHADDCVVLGVSTADSFSITSNYADGGTTRFGYFRGGFTANGTGGDSTNWNGTSGHPIQLLVHPGANVNLSPASAAPTEVDIALLQAVNYWRLRGFESSGGYGSGVIVWDASTHVDIESLYIHDRDMDSAPDNSACIKSEQDSTDIRMHHNHVRDCYQHSLTGGQNNSNIVFFRGVNNRADHNVIVQNDGLGYGIKVKHGRFDGNIEIDGNYLKNFTLWPAIASGIANSNVHNNLIIDADAGCVFFGNLGGLTHLRGDVVDNNTCVNSKVFLSLQPRRDYDSSDNAAADDCSGAAFTAMTVTDNIYSDNSASYGQETSVFTIGTYLGKPNFDAFWTAGMLQSNNNTIYNSSSTAFRADVFESSDANTTCGGRSGGSAITSWAAWQAAGEDAASSNADPVLDASFRSTAFVTRGYNTTTTGSSTSTSSTTTTTTLPPTPAGGPMVFIE